MVSAGAGEVVEDIISRDGVLMILIFIILITMLIIWFLNGYDEAKRDGVVNNEYTTKNYTDSMDK